MKVRATLCGAALAALCLPAPALAREEVITINDVPYGTVDGEVLRLDVYQPVTFSDGPAVVLIHGGGWRSGDKVTWAKNGKQLAAEGFVAFSINYRLAPPGGGWHAPAPAEDVLTAIEWIQQNATVFGVDPSRIGVMGSSAGGHLAMMVGSLSNDVDAVVSWSGPSELTQLPPPGALATAENFVGCGVDECPGSWAAASPITYVNEDSAPMLVANSSDEEIPVDQAYMMADRLEEAGVPHELEIVKGSAHGIALRSALWEDSVDFLRAILDL